MDAKKRAKLYDEVCCAIYERSDPQGCGVTGADAVNDMYRVLLKIKKLIENGTI